MIDTEVNVELVFNTVIRDYFDSYWRKNFTLIRLYMFFTRILPLMINFLVLTRTSTEVLIIGLVTTFLLLLNEINIMINFGIKKYFADPLNYLDFLGNLAGIFW